MRLPGNNRAQQDGNPTNPPVVPAGNDNQMDEVMSNAIDTFLGSSMQTYDEFIQNFTQLSTADLATTDRGNPAEYISSLAMSDPGLSAMPGHLGRNIRPFNAALPDGPFAASHIGTGIFSSVQDSTMVPYALQDHPYTRYRNADISSEFPGRDEPPEVPPVIATGDDELEEEILDVATTSYAGLFTPNSAGRNLQVDNFVCDEDDHSDEEKGDQASEKGFLPPINQTSNAEEDDLPVYQASFLQPKSLKSEKNEANQLQQTIDKAQKDSMNVHQQHLNRCSTAIANAEERLVETMYSLHHGHGHQPSSSSTEAGPLNSDWTATGNPGSGHRHTAVKVQLQPSEEDLLDIIGDDIESDSDSEDCDLSDLDSDYLNSDHYVDQKNYELSEPDIDRIEASDDIDGIELANVALSAVNAPSLQTDQRGAGEATQASNGTIGPPINIGDYAGAFTQAVHCSIAQLPQHHQLSGSDLITDAEIDKIMFRHSQLLNMSDSEEDEESAPVLNLRDSPKEATNSQDDSEESLVYNSQLDSYNVGEVQNEEEFQNSLTNIRKLSYSAKPQLISAEQHEEGMPLEQMNSEPNIWPETASGADEVEAFSLDEAFDYDNVTLTPKFNAAEMEYLRSFLPPPK